MSCNRSSQSSPALRTPKTPPTSPGGTLRINTRQGQISAVYDGAIGSQEAIVERAKQVCLFLVPFQMEIKYYILNIYAQNRQYDHFHLQNLLIIVITFIQPFGNNKCANMCICMYWHCC